MTKEAVEIDTTPPETEDEKREVAEAAADLKAATAEKDDADEREAARKRRARQVIFKSLEDYLRCEEIETDGAWFPIPGWPEGAQVKVAHISNAYSKLRELERAYRTQEKLGDTDPIPDHINVQIDTAGLWGTAVKGLRGLPDGQGGVVPPTEETFKRLMKVRRFRMWLLALGGKVYETWHAQQERDRGNLSPVSAG